MKETSDSLLAQRAAAGDRDAFSMLLDRHYSRIYRLGMRMMNHADDAADLVQEICLHLPSKLASYRGESQFTTWLYRVVVNAAHDAIRRDSARKRNEHAQSEATCLVGDTAASDMSQAIWLQQLLGQLSEELRSTALLVFEEGLRHAEVGEILGISETTVSWRIHQLRKLLRNQAKDAN